MTGVFGPLSFSNQSAPSQPIFQQLFPTVDVLCLFCDKLFKFYQEKNDYLAHLYLEHRLIIGDEEQIAIFHEYLSYWREIFSKCSKDHICTSMIMDQLPDGTPSKNEQYFLLCDVTPQDFETRQNLQLKQLELALAQHQFERIDSSIEKNCLFCRDVIKSTRYHYVEHLFSKHFLQLGKAENLVFIDELIDTVQQNLNNLICLFCEKKFKDRTTLKEHMRKKGHKRINPENKSYDKFFLIHYQNQSIGNQTKKNTHTRNNKTDDDTNWSDWEDDEKLEVRCLLCPEKNSDFVKIKEHIKAKHGIDFDNETKGFSFYDRVKMVNYIRRKMYKMECMKCEEHFQNQIDLHKHLLESKHFCLGDRQDWDFPQYFFPTYEDDVFLCHLDDTNLDNDEKSDDNLVICEDQMMNLNLEAETLYREIFLNKTHE